MTASKEISIIIPVYNSETTLSELVDRLFVELSSRYSNYEIILVNDGSKDNSYAVCKSIAKEKAYVKFITFHKNFGQISAFMAGYAEAEGSICLLMDDDLQNPPEEIHKVVDGIHKGYDFVFGVPEKVQQKIFRRIVSRLNNKMARWMLHKPEDIYLSSFLALRHDIVQQILQYSGPFPYIAGLIFRVTDNGCNVIVRHDVRKHGTSHYNLRRLIRHWLAGSTNFSIIPLRVASLGGMFLSFIGFAVIIGIIYLKLFGEGVISGWVSLMGTVLFFSGVQLLALGVMGEYIGRMFMIINKAPQYSIKEKYNCKSENQ